MAIFPLVMMGAGSLAPGQCRFNTQCNKYVHANALPMGEARRIRDVLFPKKEQLVSEAETVDVRRCKPANRECAERRRDRRNRMRAPGLP